MNISFLQFISYLIPTSLLHAYVSVCRITYTYVHIIHSNAIRSSNIYIKINSSKYMDFYFCFLIIFKIISSKQESCHEKRRKRARKNIKQYLLIDRHLNGKTSDSGHELQDRQTSSAHIFWGRQPTAFDHIAQGCPWFPSSKPRQHISGSMRQFLTQKYHVEKQIIKLLCME